MLTNSFILKFLVKFIGISTILIISNLINLLIYSEKALLVKELVTIKYFIIKKFSNY